MNNARSVYAKVLNIARFFLLQGYMPQSSGRRVEVLSRKRLEYHIWVKEHHNVDDIERSEDELRILHQIRIDVPRTAALGFLPSSEVDGVQKWVWLQFKFVWC